MTLQQLKYIIMVAETGTITEAASRLFISQPSLTNAIHELEKEMNITIFDRTNKGIHISYLKSLFNSKLRNAVGHNDYEYNSISQEITYYPDPKNRSRQYKEYLLECENEAVHMFQGILAVSEFLYRLRELKMMHDGNASMIECMSKKINVYDLCPCGSGKKHKFCHKKSV